MKFLFLFLALLSLSFCEPAKLDKLKGAEEIFVEIKKNVLECLSKEENTTPELRKFVSDMLATDLKENFSLQNFLSTDIIVIRKCKKEAFNLEKERWSMLNLDKNKAK